MNPAFIELNGRGGLGWLKGFNELVTRCGYEWVGHPGMDQGVLLPLHGLAANIPASKVVLSIEEKPPYTIRFKGDLKEQGFKKVNFLVETELSTEAGAEFFTLHDTPTLVRRYWTRAPASARPYSRSHPSMDKAVANSAARRVNDGRFADVDMHAMSRVFASDGVAIS